MAEQTDHNMTSGIVHRFVPLSFQQDGSRLQIVKKVFVKGENQVQRRYVACIPSPEEKQARHSGQWSVINPFGY
jgi:hypothetical protein